MDLMIRMLDHSDDACRGWLMLTMVDEDQDQHQAASPAPHANKHSQALRRVLLADQVEPLIRESKFEVRTQLPTLSSMPGTDMA